VQVAAGSGKSLTILKATPKGSRIMVVVAQRSLAGTSRGLHAVWHNRLATVIGILWALWRSRDGGNKGGGVLLPNYAT
jgi:hypothetical protein